MSLSNCVAAERASTRSWLTFVCACVAVGCGDAKATATNTSAFPSGNGNAAAPVAGGGNASEYGTLGGGADTVPGEVDDIQGTPAAAAAHEMPGPVPLLQPDGSMRSPAPSSEPPVAQTGGATIVNDTFWADSSGTPIYSQGGGVLKVDDTYYWYGVKYNGAVSYAANQRRNDDTGFNAVTVYSSTDLVHWKFENNILARGANGSTLDPSWLGRLARRIQPKYGEVRARLSIFWSGRVRRVVRDQ